MSASKPAAMPFFGDAYLADTTHLTTEEHGAYFLLLLAAWRQDDCALPYDDRKLARIAGLTPRKWKSIKPTIMEFWRVEDGRIHQTRQRKEHTYVCKKSEQNRQAAATRWNKQTTEKKQGGGMRTHSKRNAPPPPPHIEEPKGSSPPISPRPSGDAFPCPEWCDQQVWRDLKRNRAKKRLANTATAHKLFLREVDKLTDDDWPPGRLVEAIVARGWGGAYDPRPERNPTNARQHSRSQQSTTRQIGERIASRIGAGGGRSTDLVPLPGPSRWDD